jgi:hypothetical protein
MARWPQKREAPAGADDCWGSWDTLIAEKAEIQSRARAVLKDVEADLDEAEATHAFRRSASKLAERNLAAASTAAADSKALYEGCREEETQAWETHEVAQEELAESSAHFKRMKTAFLAAEEDVKEAETDLRGTRLYKSRR